MKSIRQKYSVILTYKNCHLFFETDEKVIKVKQSKFDETVKNESTPKKKKFA